MDRSRTLGGTLESPSTIPLEELELHSSGSSKYHCEMLKTDAVYELPLYHHPTRRKLVEASNDH
jgi:hypothetical protein